MTVRFKSEYQKSFPHPRSASPVPSAGLRSDHMGASREPCLQRRRRLGGRTQSCRSLLPPSDPGPSQEPRTAPSADLRGSSAHRKDPKPATASGAADPEAPPGPRPTAEPEPPEGLKAKPESGRHPGSQPAAEPAEKAANMSDTLIRPPSGPQPSANRVLRWKAGLTSGGHRSGSRTSEYRRQFGSKKPGTAVSPILTADQVINSSRRAVTMETEYRQSYQDPAPPAKPRLRKHLEAQRVPLFHVHMSNKKTEASQKKPRRHKNAPSHHSDEATPPPQVQRPRRKVTEYESSFGSPFCRILEEGGATDDHASQVAALRRQARWYRRRAWGVNFCREHLNQLQSEHTVLWEPAETTASDPPTPTDPPTASDPPTPTDRRGPSRQEKENSSQWSGTDGEGPPDATAKTTEEENTDEEEEGRLPTPRLKMLPVQRTHHDLTTPATGGAMLVGRLKPNGDEQVAVEAGPVLATPLRCKEAWPEVDATHVTPRVSSPVRQSAELKEVKSPEPPPALAPPPPVLATPPHCLQGSLRTADFQHNGDLGLRLRDLCAGGGCGSGPGAAGSGSGSGCGASSRCDPCLCCPDDRLSLMSWRSAASCCEASAVLERARSRRDDFWGR